MQWYKRVYIPSHKTTTQPNSARVLWTRCYKKKLLFMPVPATQSWNSFHRAHIDFILFPCLCLRRHLSFFVLIFLKETEQQFCKEAPTVSGNVLVFLSTNQEQTKTRYQSTFSHAWHPLHIFPRLTLIAWLCFQFWLVHGVIRVCCAYHGSGFSTALQNLSMSRPVNLTRICNISKKCNCYLQTDLTLVSGAWRSRKYCHTPDWHIVTST